MCPRKDSNLHASRHTHLKRARLPIPPLGLLYNHIQYQKSEENETRTHTTQLSLPPQSSASTNSAISPLFHFLFKERRIVCCLCPRKDSNLHASRHTHLKRARLPIPPLGLLDNLSILGAENETRTRDPNLGKVVLYQLSYFRKLLHNLQDFRRRFSKFK